MPLEELAINEKRRYEDDGRFGLHSLYSGHEGTRGSVNSVGPEVA